MSLKWANFIGVGAQAQNFAFVEMNGNAELTTIALANTYQAMDVTGISETHMEQWSLIDAVDGIIQYDNGIPFTGNLIATICALKTTSVKNYRFAVSINGAVPVFASASHMPIEIKTTKVSVTYIAHVDMVPDDTFQLMVAGDGTDDNLTITDVAISLVLE